MSYNYAKIFIKSLQDRFRIGHVLIYIMMDDPQHYLVRFHKINIPFIIKNPWFDIKIYDKDLPPSPISLHQAIRNGIVKALSEDIHSL